MHVRQRTRNRMAIRGLDLVLRGWDLRQEFFDFIHASDGRPVPVEHRSWSIELGNSL